MFLSPFLPIACSLSLAGGHADLHPSNANLFFEVPDVEAAIVAYKNAPLAQLLKDVEVREFLGPLLDRDPEEVSFGVLADWALTEMRDELPVLGVQALELLPDVRRASLSISGLELEGMTDELKAGGGEWSPAFFHRAGKARLQVVFDFASEELSQGAADLIQSQMGALEDTSTTHLSAGEGPNFGGEQLAWDYHSVNQGVYAVWVGTIGPRLVLGAGVNPDPKEFLVDSASLSTNERFAASGRDLQGTGGVTVLESYTSLSGIQELPKLLDLVPGFPSSLKGIAAFVQEAFYPSGMIEARSRVRLVGSRFVSESFQREFEPERSQRYYGTSPVTRASFDMVPADAVGAWGTHLDKAGIHETIVGALAGISGGTVEETVAVLEEEYGFRPDRDLIAPLGGRFVIYTMPFTGIGMPKIYAALELEDHEAFARGLEGLGNYLSASADEGVIDFSSRPYRKHPFMSIAPGEAARDADSGQVMGVAILAPAFVSGSLAMGVLPDRAILSLSKMFTKREMKRLLKSEGESAYAILPGEVELPSDALSYGRTDWGTMVGGLYESVRGFLPLIEQGMGEDLPFEIDEMPPSSLFKRYIHPTVSWDRRVEGGFYEMSQASFGPEISAMLTMLVASAVFDMGTTQGTPVAVVGAPQDEAEIAETTAGHLREHTVHSMRELKLAILVYEGEVGVLPPELISLLEPTKNFPNGFLDAGVVPTDAWGGSFKYSVPKEGGEYKLWSKGVNGTDESGAGDDVGLPDSDG
jgi:hypothetical protein